MKITKNDIIQMKRTSFQLIFLMIFFLTVFSCEKTPEIDEKKTYPVIEITGPVKKINSDKEWYDSNNVLINAHSGGILYDNGYYYWYGEDAKGWAYKGIHCYKSKDLMNWTDMGIVMPVDETNNESDIRKGCLIQRPKVVYNSSTKKYVALFKLYSDGTYTTCHVGVAVSLSPTGPFIYSNRFLGASETGCGDFALYQDTNGDLYHICVARGLSGRPSKYAKMNPDYTTPNSAGYLSMSGVSNNTEGQAIIKRGNIFHLIGSASTGWDPNAARYFTSTSLGGPWTSQGNPCKGTNSITNLDYTLTYGGQSTFIVQIQGAVNRYIVMMDVWKPGDLGNSKYIWLPFKINDTTNKLSIKWVESWDMTWYDNN